MKKKTFLFKIRTKMINCCHPLPYKHNALFYVFMLEITFLVEQIIENKNKQTEMNLNKLNAHRVFLFLNKQLLNIETWSRIQSYKSVYLLLSIH